jgi:hypothetical protein
MVLLLFNVCYASCNLPIRLFPKFSYNSIAPRTAIPNIAPTCPISPPVYHWPYRPPAKPTTAIFSPALRVLPVNSKAAAKRSKAPKSCLSYIHPC